MRVQEWCSHGVVISALVMLPGALDRHQLPKFAVLALMAVVGVAAAAVNGTLGWSRTFTALGVLVGVLAVSSLVSDGVMTALLGSGARRMGVASWVLLGAVAALGSAHRQVGEVGRLFRTVVSVGSAVAALAVFQVVKGGVGTRPISTLGSAAATGAFLAVSLVITCAVLRGDRSVRRPLVAGAIALQTVALLCTASRGALAGAVIGVLMVCSPMLARLGRSARISAILTAVVVAGAVVAVMPSAGSSDSATPRAPDEVMEGRADLIGMGIAAIGERPVIGWGADQGRPAMHPHIPEGFEATFGDARPLDSGGSVLLDITMWAGIIGLLAMLWFVITAVAGARSVRGEWWRAASCAALVAYGVHLVAGSPSAHTDATMWLLLGVVTPLGARRLRLPVRAATPVAAVLVGVLTLMFGRGLVSEWWMGRAIAKEEAFDTALAGDYFLRAREFSSSARTLEAFARYELRSGYTDRAPEAARLALDAAPADPYLVELRVATDAAVAQLDANAAAGEVAADEARGLIEQSPWDGSLHLVLGDACMATGDLDCAIAAYSDATEIIPRRGDTWRLLGIAHEVNGEIDAAKAALRKALEINPKDAVADQHLVDLGG
jgi:O-antigen ligase